VAGVAGGVAELLAQHRVPRPGPAEGGAQEFLDRPVGVADRRQVGLGLDAQVECFEPLRRHRVGLVGELVRQAQVVLVASHDPETTG